MADVTGPIPTLPNSRHAVPEGTMCDDHPERPAVRRIQGETDSFGSEMHDLCQECLDAHSKEVAEADYSGTCDWCKEHKPRLWNQRDSDEGMYGPVYLVCDDCSRKQSERLAEEMSRYEPLDDYWDGDDE